MPKLHPPMFCDNCSLLALAVLDGAPLCLDCLLDELKNSTDSNPISKVQPLNLIPVDLKEVRRNPGLGPTPRFAYTPAAASKTAH